MSRPAKACGAWIDPGSSLPCAARVLVLVLSCSLQLHPGGCVALCVHSRTVLYGLSVSLTHLCGRVCAPYGTRPAPSYVFDRSGLSPLSTQRTYCIAVECSTATVLSEYCTARYTPTLSSTRQLYDLLDLNTQPFSAVMYSCDGDTECM